MMLPVATTSSSSRAVSNLSFMNQLDSFFPFDPYLLKRQVLYCFILFVAECDKFPRKLSRFLSQGALMLHSFNNNNNNNWSLLSQKIKIHILCYRQ